MKKSRTLLVLTTTLFLASCLPGAEAEAHAQHDATKADGPANALHQEHDLTLAVLAATEAEAAKLRSGNADPERIRRILQFFKNFTDRCHHAKEEHYYFPAAKAYGDEELDRWIATLKNEHALGKAMLETVGYLLDQKSEHRPMMAERLETYCQMLRTHIRKENEWLIPRASVLLPSKEQEALKVAFERFEHVELGKGFHEKYHRLAKDITGHQH